VGKESFPKPANWVHSCLTIGFLHKEEMARRIILAGKGGNPSAMGSMTSVASGKRREKTGGLMKEP